MGWNVRDEGREGFHVLRLFYLPIYQARAFDLPLE
jgi:hypothetical protein